MKINTASLIFETLKYWLKNGKTTTSLVVGVITALLTQLGPGFELTPEKTDMLLQFIPFLTMFGAGIIGRIRKGIEAVIAQKKAEAETGNATV